MAGVGASRAAVAVASSLLAGGCATVGTGGVLLGIGHVEDRADTVDPRVRHGAVSGIGVWVGVGPDRTMGLGAIRTNWLEIPADCRVVVAIPAEWPAERAAEFIRLLDLRRSDLCATNGMSLP